jgi:hypothetical protein
MSWSVNTVTFFLGLALMVVAILGGGLEIKEVKIPSMGRLARAVSFVIGCGLLALALAEPEYLDRLATNSSPATTNAVSAQDRSLYLFNVLDPNQESEKVEVTIDGNPAGVLDIDKIKTTAGITYRTKKETVHYSIKGAQMYRLSKEVHSYQLTGDGDLHVVDGARYQLWAKQESGSQKIVEFKQE